MLATFFFLGEASQGVTIHGKWPRIVYTTYRQYKYVQYRIDSMPLATRRLAALRPYPHGAPERRKRHRILY